MYTVTQFVSTFVPMITEPLILYQSKSEMFLFSFI